MLGAIAGDMIGSVYEFNPTKSRAFPLFSTDSTFTDDSVLTVAVADCLLHGKDYAPVFREYVRQYPARSYGNRFLLWAGSSYDQPYGSWGNGSAMRVSPVGWAFNSLDQVLFQAKKSAEVTHNHPEGVKGAQATAAVIYLGRMKKTKPEIRDYIRSAFYPLDRTLLDIWPEYRFDESCQGTVPAAILAFLESSDFEDAIRKAVALGGDADTLACITGGMAEAFYGGVPEAIARMVRLRLDPDLEKTVTAFREKYCPAG
jgi:ADP-ribosylglycohydrolase